MKLEIATSNGRLNEALFQYVEQRIRSGLLRFENRITGATVSFSDLSGPYGAEEQCRLVLRLTPSGEVSFERRGASARLALARAVEACTRELRCRFEGAEQSG